MVEYTDKTALVEKIANIRVYVAAARQSGKGLAGEVLHMYRDAVLEAIRKAPAADVVEVVRCKDCIKTSPFDDGLLRFCKKMQEYRYPDNYCSDGRRRKTNGPQ